MEIMNSWMLEGMEKGIKQGRLQGLQEGGAALVLRLLQRRIGPLSAAQEKRVRRLNVERLEELGEALLDFSAVKDLNDWLAAHK